MIMLKVNGTMSDAFAALEAHNIKPRELRMNVGKSPIVFVWIEDDHLNAVRAWAREPGSITETGFSAGYLIDFA